MIYNIESKTDLDKNELKLSEKNDILIPCSGETAIDLATASCIQKDQVAIGGDITVIKTNQYAPFITYYLNQKKTEIAKYAQGISIVHLYPKDFKVMNIRIPSFNEQKKIIALLEEITKKEQLLESKYQQYQEFKKYLMQQIFTQKLRVCSYKMFDRYFELTIGENEMSNVAFEIIIQSDNYEFIKQEVLSNDNDGKSENFLEKLKTNVQKIDSKNIKLFLRLLFDIGDNLNVDTGEFIFSKNTLLLQNIGALSKQLNNQQLYESMDYAIKNAEDCLYLLVDDLSIHDKINQRYRFKNNKSNGKKELTNDQLDKLENEACIKIKQWADNGKIFEVYRAIEVIYNWYYWDNEEYFRFIEKTLENDTELIKLIIIFINEISNENDTVNCEFNFSIMEEICPIDKIYNRIHSIISKIENTDHKIVCENFIEKYNQNIIRQ